MKREREDEQDNMDLYADPRDEDDYYNHAPFVSPAVVFANVSKKRKIRGDVGGQEPEEGIAVARVGAFGGGANGKVKVEAEDRGREVIVLD